MKKKGKKTIVYKVFAEEKNKKKVNGCKKRNQNYSYKSPERRMYCGLYYILGKWNFQITHPHESKNEYWTKEYEDECDILVYEDFKSAMQYCSEENYVSTYGTKLVIFKCFAYVHDEIFPKHKYGKKFKEKMINWHGGFNVKFYKKIKPLSLIFQ